MTPTTQVILPPQQVKHIKEIIPLLTNGVKEKINTEQAQRMKKVNEKVNIEQDQRVKINKNICHGKGEKNNLLIMVIDYVQVPQISKVTRVVQ